MARRRIDGVERTPGRPDTAARVADGLARLSTVLRAEAWERAGARGLTPTQGHALAALAEAPTALRLGEVARALDVAAPTASKAVSTLEEKGLLEKVGGADGRAVHLALTPRGRREAAAVTGWTERLAAEVARLEPEEQRVMLRALVKMIRALQAEGRVSAARTCPDCVHFRPYEYPESAETPHHCAFVDAPFGDGGLQVACPDHRKAEAAQASAAWRRFLRVVP